MFESLFNSLFDSPNSYIANNSISKIWVTGHSLGGAVVEHFMENNIGDQYSAVTFASPQATLDGDDTRILNIGYENDIVYSISGFSDKNNSTTRFFTAIGSEHDVDETGIPTGDFTPKEHSILGYVYSTERILKSQFYNQIKKDSFVVIDQTDKGDDIKDIISSWFGDPDTFILGEDNRDDELIGGQADDFIEALGGNDFIEGGQGNDNLDGGQGDNDVAVFTQILDNYDYRIINENTLEVIHARGNQQDGTDILKNIENINFSNLKLGSLDDVFSSGVEQDSFSSIFGAKPILIIPGIGGTFAADLENGHMDWLLNRGVAPEDLQIDPLVNTALPNLQC